jgi:predicted DsbA family dithiol-disulfide isomerase
MSPETPVRVAYFSDVLCVWAYLAQIKVDEVRATFGSQVEIESRFISVFGDTAAKLGAGWKDRGGFAGYARHVAEIAARFPHAPVHPEVWTRDAPASSMGCHLLLEAVRVLCDQGALPPLAPAPAAGAGSGRPLVEELAWRLRRAFFAETRNVGQRAVQHEIAESLGLPLGAIDARIADGSAFAALSADAELQRTHAVQGSPTWLLNEGRQKLYGNVGYRVIEANLREALAAGTRDLASWC